MATQTLHPVLDISPDPIPPLHAANEMEDNADTTGTVCHYTIHTSTNNIESDIQSNQTYLRVLAPIPTLWLHPPFPTLTPPIKVTALLRRLRPLGPLLQMISMWN